MLSMYVEAFCHTDYSRLTDQTLTVLLTVILGRRYVNTSTDIIVVLAGLHAVDSVFTDFANAIETLIRSGRTGTSPKPSGRCGILMLARKLED